MLWSQFVLCILVGLTYASSNPAWKDNTEYVYEINGRTLSGLQDAADQYSGTFLKAKLHISSLSDGKLQGRFSEANYAQVQAQLPDGWASEVDESQLSYKQLPLSQKPFRVVMERGLIKRLIVEKDLTNWEANLIKGILSQFQLDTQGQNAIPSQINNVPDSNQLDGVFKTMEETITGESETLYEIHRLPEYLLQSKPWLAPLEKLRNDRDVIEVIKSKNYTNAAERPSYHYGFGEINELEPTSNKMGQFFIRESSSRAILTGKPSRYTIQSSYTVNKNFVNPTFKHKAMGSIISMVNATLREVNTQAQQPQDMANPIDIGNLVYTYQTPFSNDNQVHKKQQSSSNMRSSDSSEEEESSESARRRFRRSARQMINKQSQESSESSESSSSEENMQNQPRPRMSDAPESPLLPTMMGYHGKSIKESRDFDIKQNVEKLAQEIAEDMQEPEKIQSESTLGKYSLLNTFVRMMNEEEIKDVAEQLYTQSKQGKERDAWAAYRDSVAEAGTGPAFMNIQQWIESKKIQNQEAAEAVSTMARAVRVPTEEYMRKFFEMIKGDQIKKQHYLNQTAVLSFTELVHKVYINRNESHNQYPVHAFGNFDTKEGREFVKSTVIPYFSQQLEEAIQRSNAPNIHVYIKALGNIGHKKILEAYEPYLEGNKQASQFQRMYMVVCMRQLATSNPKIARSVLYKIYQNRAEIPEVRVAAVFQLMRTNPPAEMLQRMAQNTNTDSQEQVNAAVKSAIESASQLNSDENDELQKAADSAKHLLTRKQYGAAQSHLDMRSFMSQQTNVEMQHYFAEIGSEDSNWPKSVGLRVDGDLQGMNNHYFKVGGIISSIRELTNAFYEQTQQHQNDKAERSQQRSSDNKWSSANIAQYLNYQREEREQFEAVIFAELAHNHKLWSFDNQTFEQLPEYVREQEESLKNGKQFSYSKLKQLKEVALSYPTEMGLPLLYTYDMPMLIKFEGKIKASATPQISSNNKLHKPDQISAEIDGQITMASKTQCHLSFVTPFDHQVYMAGYDKNMQVHVPLKTEVEVDVNNQEAKIESDLQEPHKDARLFQYNTYPYTSRSDVMSTRPVALRPNTRIIKVNQKEQSSFDFVFGQKETGMAFRAQGHSPQRSFNLGEFARIWNSEDMVSMWHELWCKSPLAYTEASIAFVPSQSTARKVILRYRHEEEYNKQPQAQNQEEFLNLNQLASKLQSDEPKQRQEEIMRHVGSGIQSSELTACDVSLQFEGDKTYQHVLGLAYAKSNADPKSRTLFYYKNKDQGKQFAVEVKGKVPNTNGLDLAYSLDSEPSAQYDFQIQQGRSDDKAAKISGRVDLSRSKARKQYLINEEPLYRVCKEEMQQGNFQLPACQNMTIRANFLNDIQYQVEYEHLNEDFTEAIEGAFQALRVYYYPQTEIKNIPSKKENMVSGRIQFHPNNFRKVDVTVRRQDEETKMSNLSTSSEVAKNLFVPHPVFHLRSRIEGVLQGWENFRQTCVIDRNDAQTFNNYTYPLSLDKQYTVVMQYVPQNARSEGHKQQSVENQLKDQSENYVILTRQVSAEQKELILTFNRPESQGKTVQIDMKPKQQSQYSGSNPAATVAVDGQQIQFDDKQIADLYDGVVQIYALPNGEVKAEFQDAFYVIFDGQRVKLTATGSKLRGSTSGLCGRFTNDKYEDFTAPSNCVLRDPKKFVESYQVDDSQHRRPQRSGEWQQECVSKQLPLYADVISDRDAGRSEKNERQRSSGSSGTKLRHRYVEENDEICFTIRPVPECKSSPRETVSKNVPVHCVQATKTASYLKKQIDRGGNPDFSRKSESKKVRMDVPLQCN